MNGLLQSKKFWMSIVGVVAVLASHFFGVNEETITKVAAIFSSYLLAQGAADFGKSAKK